MWVHAAMRSLDPRAVGSIKAIFRFDIPHGPVVAHAANIPIRSAVLQVAVNQMQGAEPLLPARVLKSTHWHEPSPIASRKEDESEM
jgi:hypothetical protein